MHPSHLDSHLLLPSINSLWKRNMLALLPVPDLPVPRGGVGSTRAEK